MAASRTDDFCVVAAAEKKEVVGFMADEAALVANILNMVG